MEGSGTLVWDPLPDAKVRWGQIVADRDEVKRT